MSDIKFKNESEDKIEHPSMYKLILYNDDYTPYEFVIALIMSACNKSSDEAKKITKNIHENGKGIAGVYTFDIASTKKMIIQNTVKKFGFPLKVEIEEESI